MTRKGGAYVPECVWEGGLSENKFDELVLST